MRTQYFPVLAAVVLLGAAGMNPASGPSAAVASGASPVSGASSVTKAASAMRHAQVDAAVTELASSVAEESREGALRTAVQAYFNFKAAHPERVNNPYLYYVDYGLDSRTPRGYVFNMETETMVDGPFIVAHGRGSSKSKNGVPTRFSNREGSATTSLGLFVTQETYGFSGHTAGRLYYSVGLRLEGVSGKFNDAARERRVVVHGAPYVTPGGAGRSEGCPAMELDRARTLIPLIANGGLVFLYSPADAEWTASDPWATAEF